MLAKVTVETARNAELNEHLVYNRHEKTSGNIRNGYFSKTLRTEDGQLESVATFKELVATNIRLVE